MLVEPIMDGSEAGHQSGVDWETVTIVQAQQRWTGGRRPDVVRIKVGTVRTAAGPRIAVQVDDRAVIVVPPASAARVIGALREALRGL